MNAPLQIIVPSDFRHSSIPASDKDLDKLARTLFGETRGEIFEGKVAVAWAIRNRVITDLWNDKKPDWWGEGWMGVCLADWQFTCWKDKNKAALEAVTLADAHFQDCYLAALCAVKGLIPDNTFRSTHYFNPDAVEAPPKWSLGRVPNVVIGRHHFYAGIERGDPNYKPV